VACQNRIGHTVACVFTNINKHEGQMGKEYKTKSMRLEYWDYTTPWWYFITISTNHHIKYFGKIISGKMKLNEIGKIVKFEWLRTAELRKNVELDEFVIMPNHFHGIIILSDNESVETRRGVSDETNGISDGSLNFKKTRRSVSLQREFSKPIKDSLSTIINLYKGSVTKTCRAKKLEFKWQPKFYDRIIRNERELLNIRKYIEQNPLKWELENEIPNNSEL
jgi:REP-associated tyrosine transposase